MAAPFDVSRREVGGPVTLVEDVMQAANMPRPSADSGAGQFAVAGGALVYASGGVTPQPQSELVWVDRMGNVEPLRFPARDYIFPRLSPDGTAPDVLQQLYRRQSAHLDVRFCAAARSRRRSRRQKNAERGRSRMDDERIVFSSSIRGTGLNLSTRRVTDSGPSERLTTGRRSTRPGSWSACA